MNVTSTSNNKANLLFWVALALVISFMFANQAHAGTGGTEFDDIWTTITDWTQGTLGRIIAGSMILVGIVGGIARQSIMAFAMGIGGGVGLYNSPTVIEAIMTATLESAEKIAPAAIQISNGLGL